MEWWDLEDEWAAEVAEPSRKRSWVQVMPEWVPGAGVPCYAFGPAEERRRSEWLLHTTLLYNKLEDRVNIMYEQRTEKERRDREISMRIAAAHPLSWDDAESESESESDFQSRSGRVSSTLPCFSAESHQFAAQRDLHTPEEFDTSKEISTLAHSKDSPCSDHSQRSPHMEILPSPLTEEVLSSAARELPQGSSNAIKSCMRSWLERKLDDSELVSTVRSFADTSDILKHLFTSIENRQQSPKRRRMEQISTPQQKMELAS